jgi:hypothetical protein
MPSQLVGAGVTHGPTPRGKPCPFRGGVGFAQDREKSKRIIFNDPTMSEPLLSIGLIVRRRITR